MNIFTKGVLAGVGIGIGVGLLVAPLGGKETRHVLAERTRAWRNALPEDSRLNQSLSQASDWVASTKEQVRGYTQQAVSQAKETGAALSNRAIQTGQDLANRAIEAGQEMSSRVSQAVGWTSSGPDGAHMGAMPEPED